MHAMIASLSTEILSDDWVGHITEASVKLETNKT